MYLAHYGFREEPFSITSNPRFLWLSHQHEEAYAHLLYAIEQRKGFAVLSGDIGTGKTTLINSVLDRLGDKVQSAVVYNSSLNTEELFRYLFRDFDIPRKAEDRADSIIALNDWLLAQAEAEINTVIIIDEAQNLSLETMEDLRLLSNLETSSKKLLQILLVGQPELNGKLADPSLHQLQQRIAIRYDLQPFKKDETAEYVRHRLKIAGGEHTADIFDGGALAVIHEISAGVPRVINQVCDTALLKGYGKGLKVLDRAFMQSVGDEEFAFRKQQARPAAPAASPDAPAPSAAATQRKGLSPLAAVLLVLLVAVASWAFFRGKGETPPPVILENTGEVQALQQELAEARRSMGQMQKQLEELANRPFPKAEEDVTQDPPEEDVPLRVVSPPGDPEVILVRIRQNDTLMKIVEREYGQSDWNRIDQILALNPRIKNPNLIRIGDRIRIPRP